MRKPISAGLVGLMFGFPGLCLATGTAHPFYTFTAYPSGATTNADGAAPYSSLIQDGSGTFYGTTTAGGTAGNGTLFSLAPNGTLTTLHDFTGYATGSYVNADGAIPAAGLVAGTAGTLYGTTASGGAGGNGTVIRYTGGTVTAVHAFTAYATGTSTNTDGAAPQAALTLGPDAALYGAALHGGSAGNGTLFRIDAAGAFTVLHSFTASTSASSLLNADGALPYGGLVYSAVDGLYYGTTQKGGKNGYGTVYKVSAAGVYTTVYAFAGSTDGASPAAALLHYTDGNFYGTTAGGGSNGSGTVFRLTPGGVLTTLHVFGAVSGAGSVNADGATPAAALVLDTADGNLYGTTLNGGANGSGTVYSVSPTTGTFTPQYAFANGPDGAAPYSTLLRAADGTFYGTAAFGGANGNGTVYTLALGTATPPTFSVPGATYTAAQTVALSDATPGVTIYYTLDGSTPTTSSAVYAGALTVAATQTVKAMAAGGGFPPSGIATATYTITTPSTGHSGGGSTDLASIAVLTLATLTRRYARAR